VTGATGFVGQHVLSALGAAGKEIKVLGLGLSETAGRAIDIANADAIDGIIAREKPDAIIHLAAIALPRAAKDAPDRAWAVNFQGTLNIAEALKRHRPDGHLIFASSSETYGATFARTTGPIHEDAALMPQTVYAATKACADLALGQMAADGLDCIRFRPFNHTGPGQVPLYVVADFARQVAEIEAGKRDPVIRVGNLEAKRDFLDVRDVARAYALAAISDHKASVDAAYNLASGKAVRIGDILESLISQSTTGIEIQTDADRLRANDIAQTLGDSTRAREAFGWSPMIALKQTLAAVLDDQRAQVGKI